MSETETNQEREQPNDGLSGTMQNALSEGEYLGNRTVVADLVRQFLFGIANGLEDVASGKITRDAAVLEVASSAQDMASIFLGEDDGYHPVPNWNGSPLVEWVKEQGGIDLSGADDPNSDSVVLGLYFGTLAGLFASKIAAHASGSITDDDMQEFVSQTLTDTVNTLMGIKENG